MAAELQAFGVTIPAGTAKANPQKTDLAMPPRVVRRIEVKVPSGPRGNLGFQIGMAGSQLIPYTAGEFIVSDDENLSWDFEDLPSSGAWQLIGYNLGQFDHTLQIRFLVDLPSSGPQGLPAMIPAAALES